MNFIWDKLTEWLKDMLVGGIMDALTGLFDNVNEQIAGIAGNVGATPQAWNGSIFAMVRGLSDNVVVPVAGVILALVNFLRIWFFTPYDKTVAFVVSLAMFFTIIIAKSIGCTLPLLAKAIHLDPALMASPIITTLVDAASLTVLFTFASTIMKV